MEHVKIYDAESEKNHHVDTNDLCDECAYKCLISSFIKII